MMKRNVSIVSALLLCPLIAALSFLPMTALADNTTVNGRVDAKTTSEIMYLDTNEGMMQIKIDEDTDTSACKVLLPNARISAQVYLGPDAYMHAASLSGGTLGSSATVDASSRTTAQGTVVEGTTSDMLYLKTSSGTMQIKLDATTDVKGCRIITLGKSVKISIARGSDAYMHALTVTDSDSADSAQAKPANNMTTDSTTGLPVITGKIGNNSDNSVIYINSTKYLIDPGTDFSGCTAYFKGRTASVTYYNGIDGALHATRITDNFTSSSATVSDTVAMTVKGRITDESSNDMIYLDTDEGVMQIRLDINKTDTDNCSVLYDGKLVRIAVAYGSDSYLHALKIEDR